MQKLWEAIANRDLKTLVNLLNDREEMKYGGVSPYVDQVAIEVLSELSHTGKSEKEGQ